MVEDVEAEGVDGAMTGADEMVATEGVEVEDGVIIITTVGGVEEVVGDVVIMTGGTTMDGQGVAEGTTTITTTTDSEVEVAVDAVVGAIRTGEVSDLSVEIISIQHNVVHVLQIEITETTPGS